MTKRVEQSTLKAPPRILVTVPQVCDGCRMCEIMCSLNKTGSVNPRAARLKVTRQRNNDLPIPVICRHCKNPKCLSACIVPGAMFVDEKTGVVLVNEEKCTACGACIEACPFDAIWLGPSGKVIKCDLCGGDPICVKYCQPRDQLPRANYTLQSCLQYVERSGKAGGGKSA